MRAKKVPIEDPARIARFRDAIASLEWKPGQYRASLNVIFRELSELAQAEIHYYYLRRNTSRRVSWWCRFFAWTLGAAGILIPLVHPILGESAPKQFLSWGYLAFGIVGLVLLLNNLFGGSQAHHRYTKSQLELEHLYESFSLRWQRGLVEFDQNPSGEKAISLIDEARAFVESLHTVLASETSEWKKNLDDSLSEAKTGLVVSTSSN